MIIRHLIPSSKGLSILIFILSSKIIFGQDVVLNLEKVISLTLKNNPDILISKNNALSSFSNYQSGLSEFDPVFSLAASYNKSKDPLQFGLEVILPDQEITRYNASITKKFNWGISVTPSLSVTQTNATLGLSNQTITQSRANFLVEIPLLRNRGLLGSGADLEAAEIVFHSSKSTTKFKVSEELKNTISSYLDLIAAMENVNILKESETRAENMVELTNILISADKRPKSELDLVNANLAEKKRARISSERNVFDMLQNIRVRLGINATEKIVVAEASIQEKFNQNFAFDENTKLAEAQQNRDDLRALQMQTEAKKLLMESADLNTLNRLTLRMDVGYSGLLTTAEFTDLYNAIYPPDKGLSYTIGINYELPFENLTQSSDLLRKKVDYENSIIQLDNLHRSIQSQILISLNELNLTKLEFDQAEESVNLFKRSYDNETFKQEKGLSTFFDVDQTEQKLTNALLNKINAKNDFYKSLINYKHVIGILVEPSEEGLFAIDINNLFIIDKK